MTTDNKIRAWVRGIISASIFLIFNFAGRGQGVTYVTPSQPVYYGGGPVSRNISITGSSTPDFVLYSDGVGDVYLDPQGNNSIVIVPLTGASDMAVGASIVAALNAGDKIGPNASSLNPAYTWYNSTINTIGNSGLAAQNSSGQIGNFFGLTAYIGFDLINGGQNYYGWMEVQNPVSVAAGSIVEWGYSTSPNAAVFAGGGLVPEPSSISLFICGVIIFGFSYARTRCIRRLRDD